MNSLFRLRNLLLLMALGLAVVLAAVVMRRYQPPGMAPVVTPALPTGIDLALQQIDYTHTEGGVARWRLLARRAEHQTESKLLLVKDLALTFFDDKGAEQVVLKARNGQLSNDYSVVEVNEGVELSFRDRYLLRTASLRFSQADGLIRTDDPIRLTGRNLVLDGVGLRADLAGRRLQVPARVRAVLASKSS